MARDHLAVTGDCSIPLAELEWRFSRAGGPGGQHVNKVSSKVDLRFDVARSQALSTEQRRRLLDRLGPVVRVIAADERSQARNREIALDRLRDRLAAALATTPSRKPTRPSRSKELARLEAKRRHGAVKRDRARPPRGD